MKLNELQARKQLRYYFKKLIIIKKMYKMDKKLSTAQKDKLDIYMNRAIKYCKSGKYIKYIREEWVYNPILLATYEQLIIYNQLFKYIGSLIKEIHCDQNLSFKLKDNLTSYLGQIHCHIRGKLNRRLD